MTDKELEELKEELLEKIEEILYLDTKYTNPDMVDTLLKVVVKKYDL